MTEVATRTRANALITVHRYEPTSYDEPAQGPVLTRIHVAESFSGDIAGDGAVEFLQAARADGSASFVGIERVSGSVGGREGTFLLQDMGTVDGELGQRRLVRDPGLRDRRAVRAPRGGRVSCQSRRERSGASGLLVRMNLLRRETGGAR
jgi:Protein of unknown function (DUF3224)